jgi:hypothetical protein
MRAALTNLPDRDDDRSLRLADAEKQRRRARSIAIALALGALVALFYFVTIAKLGSNVLNRAL